MLQKWLASQERNPPEYKFAVVDIAELSVPDEEVLGHLALQLVLAHGSPAMIRHEYEILCEDACFCQAKKYPFDSRKMTHLSSFV